MLCRTKILFVVFLLGYITTYSLAQDLVTECWSDDWIPYLERCYLVVSYKHSWTKANEYCSKYGAKLAEPAGIIVNREVATKVEDAGLSDFWIGYNLLGISASETYNGKWSDGRSTSVTVGVWGQNQPDLESGACTYVQATGTEKYWYTTNCDSVRPFVCEMTPCPQGMFQCSGRCIDSNNLCDGNNDCGDNRDELNCSASCTYYYTGLQGSITQVAPSGSYGPNMNCQWTIETSPGQRINVQFEFIETEANTDFLEIWDGGLTIDTSTLMSRLSGQPSDDQMAFTSSYNYLILRFVSDATVERRGFKLTWTTDYDCEKAYKTVPSSTFANTEIQERSEILGSKQTAENCKNNCEKSATCYGFVYIVQSTGASCRYFNALPILTDNDEATMYMKMCPPNTLLEASVSLPATSLTSTSQKQQLSSPLYPLPYVGNMELEFTITTDGNTLITLEILDIELCCNDQVDIYDGTTESHTLLETLSSSSQPHLLISTSQNVFIKMTLNNHWKCRGVLITYIQGCDISLSETGSLTSPGYGTSIGYPGIMECSWTLKAPSEDRSLTIVFEDFDLEDGMDFLTIEMADGNTTTYTGTQLRTDNSRTADNYVILHMRTSAIGNARGFKASFSPGCSSLLSDSVVLDSNSYDYLDVVTLRCAEGYYFTGDFVGETEVTLRCITGGVWDKTPICTRAYCGPPPLIANGYLLSGGVQGSDTATYECDSGFSAHTSMTIKCNADNVWDMAPNCTSGYCESVNSVLTDVTATIIYGDGIQYGSVARLSCAEYREIHGAATVQCMNGYWDFVNNASTICHSQPCPTPVIQNAYLTPSQPYVQNQAITVSCKRGYRLNGVSMVNCGVTKDLPTCETLQCALDFDFVVPVKTPHVFMYDYGESVEVQCNNTQYKFNEFQTTTFTLTCLDTGQWNKQISCSKLQCGVPQEVKGSIYDPTQTCLDNGCEFTFACKNKYELSGFSTFGDNRVRCGQHFNGSEDAVWDFGDLRCIGGQCPDPGYPPSGYLIGSRPSFQEDSTITFGCNIPGYGPHPEATMTCVYNEITGVMEWDRPLPTCVDKQAPVINNCPTASIQLTNMQPASFAEPFATDLNLKSFTVSPANFHPNQPINTAMTIIYRAQDFAGNRGTCIVSVLIKGSISCKNSLSVNYLVDSPAVINSSVIAQKYVNNRDPDNVFLSYSPASPTFQVTQSSTMLRRIDQVQVQALDKNQNFIESCRLQFRYRGYKCSKWGIYIPGGGGVNCMTTGQLTSCFAYCNEGTTFMESPGSGSIEVKCTEDEDEGIWDRAPPVCASISSAYVAYTSAFDYKYSITGAVTDWGTCADKYKQQLEAAYPTLESALEQLCTANSPSNPVNITVKDMTPASLSYDGVSLSVRFEVKIDIADESVDNVLALKDACTNHIQTAFNTNTSQIDSIRSLAGSSVGSLSCGSGTYTTFVGTPLHEYACEGSRKYYTTKDANNVDIPSCLSCPLGYFYENGKCSACPDGRYGIERDDGPACEICPGGVGPGMTGLTSIEQCSIPGLCPPGYYSSDGLTPCTPCPKNFYSLSSASQTCVACPSDKVTNRTGASSESECKTLEEVGTESSVCNPNPCKNGGNCTFQRNDYFCTCPPGFTGRTCTDTFNACSSNPCENYHQCVPDVANETFTCSCSAEFTGTRCELDISEECGVVTCENNGTCHNRRGGYTCVCPAAGGYTNADGSCATPINQCTENPCTAGNFIQCIPHGSYYRSCVCKPGFTGVSCETNIDDCDPNPCENGGVCADGVDSFNCTCGDEFYGEFCQFGKACNRRCGMPLSVCNSCNVNNTGECENFGNSYICHCKPGFTGTDCEIDNTECSAYPCQHGGTCHVTGEDPGYRCDCPEPWTGMNCSSEISNCPDGDMCYNDGTCYSTPSGFQCDCMDDFIGPTCNISYDLCTRVDACVGESSVCSYTEENGFECSCVQGVTGDSCQIPAPVCTPEYCLHGGTCNDSSGSLVCSCVTGYSGPRCDVNVDDCNPNPCGANQQCIDMVNAFICACDDGKRGENCDKDVGVNFDYIIESPDNCRLSENIASFGDGATLISQLTIAFWARYTQRFGEGTILNVYGSVSGAAIQTREPDSTWRFDATGLTVGVNDNKKRKKRAERSIAYRVDIADGFWHHVAMTWSSAQNRQEHTIYIDGLFKDQVVETLPSSLSIVTGFLVFGAYDAATQTGDAMNSFKGRISRLFITAAVLSDEKIGELYNNLFIPPAAPLLLHQEANLMLQCMIDYSSEVTDGICMAADSTCEGLVSDDSLPGVDVCGDVLVVTARTTPPQWPSPSFTNTNNNTRQTTMVSGGQLDWGVYGISVAQFDQNDNAAVCSFRLYNYPVGCSAIESRTDISCNTIEGDVICEGNCGNNQELTGFISAYQTCSKYSMWSVALREVSYNYPQCSAMASLKYKSTLRLTVRVTNTNCEDIKNTYSSAYVAELNALNIRFSNQLCGGNSCSSLPTNNFTCDSNMPDEGTIYIDFGQLPATLPLGSGELTPAEALKVSVADEETFTYEQSVSGMLQSVSPVWNSLVINVAEMCSPGYQISGSVCVLCGSGTYFDVTTSTCKRCPKGFYRSIDGQGITPTSQCIPCGGSLTTASDGSPNQSYCVASCFSGRYYSENTGTCVDCEVGLYQPVLGQFSCIPCPSDKTTDGSGKTSISDCVSPETITPTPVITEAPVGPSTGAASESSGLSTGVIVAVVLGVIIGILIIVLLLCLLCFKCQIPCLAKKPHEVAPERKEKDSYYTHRYGEREMRYVNHNLSNIREKKGRPLDKEPFIEPSEESGSVKNDISIHVPVFMEKLDGSISKKNVYMSNVNSPSPRPMTSSPRANVYHDIDFTDDSQHKKKRRKKGRKPAHFDGTVGGTVPIQNRQLPKALAPLPQKLKSMPPVDMHIRPSSALERPRENVEPSHYENFLSRGPGRGLRPTSSSERELLATTSSERETVRAHSTERGSRAPPSPEFEMNEYDDYRYPTKKIEVESDPEDLR